MLYIWCFIEKTRAVDLGRRFKLGLCSTRDVQGAKAATIDVVIKVGHVFRLVSQAADAARVSIA